MSAIMGWSLSFYAPIRTRPELLSTFAKFLIAEKHDYRPSIYLICE